MELEGAVGKKREVEKFNMILEIMKLESDCSSWKLFNFLLFNFSFFPTAPSNYMYPVLEERHGPDSWGHLEHY